MTKLSLLLASTLLIGLNAHAGAQNAETQRAILLSNHCYALTNAGQYDRALAECNKAIATSPKYPMAFLNRAVVRSRLKQVDLALSDYNRAIEIDPSFALAFDNRGIFFSRQAKFDLALADYATAIRLNPTAKYYIDRALVLMSNGDRDGALLDYSTALRLDRKASLALLGRGIMKAYDENYTAADADLKAVVERKDAFAPYGMIWRFIANARARDASAAKDFALGAASWKIAKWPGPVLQLFVDKQTPEGVLSAAKTDDEKCEAYFYRSVWLSMKQRDVEAKESALEAARICPATFVEYPGALIELKRQKH